MNGYPVILTGLRLGRCVVVGGGAIATRKIAGLLDAGLCPVVISPAFSPRIETWAQQERVMRVQRPYSHGDLAGASLAIAASSSPDVNRAVALEAQACSIPVNVVDEPQLSTFTVPAVLRRGALGIAVWTNGQSPAVARHVRDHIAATISDRYGDLLAVVAELRPRILCGVPRERQGALWHALLAGDVFERLCCHGIEAARAHAAAIVAQYEISDLSNPGPAGTEG